MDDALEYEYLIRRANQCSKFGVEGANSAIFQNLIRVEKMYRDFMKLMKQEDNAEFLLRINLLAFEYGKLFGEITTHISIAVNKVLQERKNAISGEQQETLESIKQEINEATLEELTLRLYQINRIFHELGLILV